MTALTDQPLSELQPQQQPGIVPESSTRLCPQWSPHPGKRILVVDDDDGTRKILRAFLELEGYTVLCCSDGLHALEVLRGCGSVDLLVTDLNMPALSGSELADRFSQLFPSVPILIISGAVLSKDVKEGFRLRGWGFLPKPFPIVALLGRVHELTGPLPVRS